MVGQVALDRDERRARVALVADEEQPPVELARHRIDAVGERVAAPQQTGSLVRRVARQSDVSVGRNGELAVRTPRRQVDRVELVAGAEGRTSRLARDRSSTPGRTARIDPTSRGTCESGGPRDSCRRASTPGRRSSGPTRSGPWPPSSSPLRLLVPSLNPWRFRSVVWLWLVVDVRPKPTSAHRRTAAPLAWRVRLRSAWYATCGSSAHTCTARSPPLNAQDRAGRRRSPGCRPTPPADATATPKRSTPLRVEQRRVRIRRSP